MYNSDSLSALFNFNNYKECNFIRIIILTYYRIPNENVYLICVKNNIDGNEQPDKYFAKNTSNTS